MLGGSTFRNGIKLESATVNLNLNLKAATFLGGAAVLKDLQVHGLANFSETQFADGVNVMGQRMHLDKGVDFTSAVFGGNADFSDVEDHADLFFVKAKVKRKLNLVAAKIGGTLFLMDAEFDGFAGFGGMQVGYNVRAERAVFKNVANFTDARIGSFLELTGAKFEFTDGPAYFTRARRLGWFLRQSKVHGWRKIRRRSL